MSVPKKSSTKIIFHYINRSKQACAKLCMVDRLCSGFSYSPTSALCHLGAVDEALEAILRAEDQPEWAGAEKTVSVYVKLNYTRPTEEEEREIRKKREKHKSEESESVTTKLEF